MKDFLNYIFEYHHFYNQKLVAEFGTHQEKIPQSTFNLFCHCLNAHQIWNARILREEKFEVHQLHRLKELPQLIKQNHAKTLQIINEHDLEKVITYQNSKGKNFSNSIRDILFHIANHYTHHKGQIIAEFRRNNIEPLVTDYIFYKRKD